jgi:outer membrane protein assembly factor BamB
MRRRRAGIFLLLGAVLLSGLTAGVAIATTGSPPNVDMGAYNTLRDNWDPNEPALSPTDVQSASFGKLFTTTLSGSIYAQPLVVNGTVIVTTEAANAYGINATTGAIEWTRSFGSPFLSSTINCSDLTPDIGSTATPVVDPATGTVYLTTRLETGSGGLAGAEWYLQAISSSTGAEMPGYPVEITGTPYNTPGVAFNQAYALQRTGLLLLDHTVYMAFASDCDITPYRGIVVGVSTKTRTISTMWSDESGVGTDQNSQAGIWQSGAGLVSDKARTIIVTSGNGVSPQPAASSHPPATLSESVISLAVKAHGKIVPTQFFAPSNAANLDANDEDLGAGGPIVLPTPEFGTKAHRHLLVQVGKDGRIFLIDADHMGGFQQGPGATDAVLQTLGPFGGVWGQPAAYGGQGGWVYVLESGGGVLRALSYGVDGSGVPQLASSATAGNFGYTSGSPMVTSDGTAAGSAVVWAVYSNGGGGGSGELQAYNAIPSGGSLALLWSAPIGTASKFTVPTAWDGRVYVGNRSGKLYAFGTSTAAPVQAAPVDFGSVAVGSSRTLTVSVGTPRGLTLTGPVTAAGYESADGPLPSGAGSAGTTTSTTLPTGLTAGPTVPPPVQTTPLPGNVFSIRQPAAGTHLPAGSTTRLRVTFSPREAGPVVAVLAIPTTEGTRTVSVAGYGTAPGLIVSDQPLAFGSVDTGAGGKALSITFANSWDRPETLAPFALPGAPYVVSGIPAVGTVLAPQQSVTVSVRFDPVGPGSYPSILRLVSDHGSAVLPVSGTAVTGFARLAVSTTTVDLGAVPLGHSSRVTFEVGNSGTVALVITRSIAPSGSFTAPVPVPEGTTVDPGTYLDQTVTFQPTALGPTTSRYVFNSNDGRGAVVVTLLGTGT